MKRLRSIHRTMSLFLVASVVVLVAGCWTLSIHPLFTEEDLVFQPSLEGIWASPDDPEGETWQFAASDRMAYSLTLREEAGRVSDDVGGPMFQARLLRLGPELFLDLYPEKPADLDDYYDSHSIRAHSFGRLQLEDDTLRVAFLDAEWLDRAFESGTARLSHVRRGHDILLTASTTELQGFVMTHLDAAFEDWDELVRVR